MLNYHNNDKNLNFYNFTSALEIMFKHLLNICKRQKTLKENSRTIYFTQTKAYCWCLLICVVLKFVPAKRKEKEKRFTKIHLSAFCFLIPFLEILCKLVVLKMVIEHIITGYYNKDNITFTYLFI